MLDCLFCKIVAGEIPAKKVYEDKAVLAFLDIEPRAPGHTMVIPKIHGANLLELPDSSVKPLFSAVKKVTKSVVEAVRADGATIGINHGRASGQEVGHLHVHIIPRFNGDGGGPIQAIVQNFPKESLDEIRDKIIRKTLMSF